MSEDHRSRIVAFTDQSGNSLNVLSQRLQSTIQTLRGLLNPCSNTCIEYKAGGDAGLYERVWFKARETLIV